MFYMATLQRGATNFNAELEIRIPDKYGIQMVDICPVVKWSDFGQKPFENQMILGKAI